MAVLPYELLSALRADAGLLSILHSDVSSETKNHMYHKYINIVGSSNIVNLKKLNYFWVCGEIADRACLSMVLIVWESFHEQFD